MFVVITKYKNDKGQERYVYWGKNCHYMICLGTERPSDGWLFDNCFLTEQYIDRKLKAIPNKMWIDDSSFKAEESKLLNCYSLSTRLH